jgi:hypothetical protein
VRDALAQGEQLEDARKTERYRRAAKKRLSIIERHVDTGQFLSYRRRGTNAQEASVRNLVTVAPFFEHEDYDIINEVKKIEKVVKKFEKGDEIKGLMLTQNEAQMNKARTLLHLEKLKHRKNVFKRWVVAAVGLVIGVLLAQPAVLLAELAGAPLYSRKGMDDTLEELFGERTFYDLNVEELLAISYEFNSNNPRFFSKYMLDDDPGRYDISLRKAIGGSSSAPLYFNPLTFEDKYGIDSQLVDGGIVSNNPSFYSYIMSKYLLNKTDIRVISLGCGRKPYPS